MNRTSQIALVVFAVLLGLCTACSRRGAGRVIGVEEDDPEMVAAIANAREKLPEFRKVFDKPEHGESGFSLKVKITDKRGTEHFWVTDIERGEGKLMGTINNDAEIVASVKLGDRIQIPEADISDWLYMRGGKMVGNETLRPLLKKMPADEAARYRDMLADP